MKMFVSSFTTTQVLLVALAGITFLSSLYFHIKQKERLAVGFLMLTTVLVYSFAAILDPFLNIWDERFHALVAKNLMNHPLMPTLYDDPVVNMDYDRWDRYHIWLHKQPLFLWQMALSYKIFGVSEFSLRIPDIILGATLVLAGYRSGKLLINPRVGYLTGVLTITTLFFVELVAGRQEVDHNDFAFLAYVSLSLWSLVEYQRTKRRFWIYLIGAFSGLAILCKWLVGLLVYLGWFVLNLHQKKYRLSDYRGLIIALSITLIVALPWQIITFVWYPAEASQAFTLNASHFWIPIDGQKRSFWYHFGKFDIIYGTLASFLIIPSLYALYRSSKDKALVVSLICTVIATYLFFSTAATKMASFTIVVSMVIFIAFAAMMDSTWQYLSQYIKKTGFRNFLFGALVVAIVLLRFDIGLLKEKHTTANTENSYTQMLMHNKAIFTSLRLPKNAVLFNVKGRHYIEAMFYTGLPAYNFVPTIEQYQELRAKGKRIAIIRPENSDLPAYLVSDPSTIIINKVITGYD